MVEFLCRTFVQFDPEVIRDAYTWNHKQHEMEKSRKVPEEAVYQHLFSATVLHAIKGTKWMLSYEVNSANKKLDFLLRLPKEGNTPEYRVGIELTASVNQASLIAHASRDYPVTMRLDEYVVVNLTSIRTEPEFSTFSRKVENTTTTLGKPTVVKSVVPIFHLLHHRDYETAVLCH